MEGKNYLIALTHFDRFGPRRLKRLFDFFGSWQQVWESSPSDLTMSGLRPDTLDLFLDFRKKFDLEAILAYIEKQNIKTIDLSDSLYPFLLREIYAPPPLLYYIGSLHEKSFASPLAIVGSRKATNYGKRVCEELIPELARSGLTIVSGLALGIDALAHEAALSASGTTIAFLGSGVDQVYPRTNTRLANDILNSGGAILSEFAPGTPPFKTNFPRRNRLIAGTCLGTLVIEAAEKSGALITARYALEEGRDVFAIPGSMYSLSSEGTNNLIKLGAKAVTNAEDVISAFGLSPIKTFATNKQSLPATPEEEIILQKIGAETWHANELARSTSLDITLINSRLTIMEMKGLVRHLGGMQYISLRHTKS